MNERVEDLTDDHKERLIDAIAEGTRIGDAARRVSVPIPLVREWLGTPEASSLALERKKALLRITAPGKVLDALVGALDDATATVQSKVAAAKELSSILGLSMAGAGPTKKKKSKRDSAGRIEKALGG